MTDFKAGFRLTFSIQSINVFFQAHRTNSENGLNNELNIFLFYLAIFVAKTEPKNKKSQLKPEITHSRYGVPSVEQVTNFHPKLDPGTIINALMWQPRVYKLNN